ncbi:hypothetical protein ABE41_008740 [Fictibacillus arsenicus]|uniref:Uncharacterized protein n=1 Tax=Fictibacillus arsenicus TaxID=255247 RepID=A0A1B1Z3U0_9BACL|nr:hypothetical protein [Fictibacillus arsenicus]ANX12092.1 hypothetical protein ABE41_008740 [Fictibacillus arsenicus]
MGYILPYVPIQNIQYAVRMEKPQRGLPVVSAVPPIQNETVPTPSSQKNHDPSGVKKRFHQVLSEIEGKGLIINETI